MKPTRLCLASNPRPRGYGRGRATWAVGLIAILVASAARSSVVTVVCSRDNTLFQDAQGDTSNGAGPACFAGNNSQNLIRRALVRFDLVGLVPAGAAVEAIELALEVTSAPDTITRSITVHRVLADWGEGSSSSSGGGGAPATAGDATWLHAFYPDLFWSQPGGDFVAAPSGSALVGDVGSHVWSSAGMRADVQHWLVEPASNFGWLLRGEEGAPRSVRRFDSRESATPANRPTLTVFFTLPVPTSSTTWGRLKALYR